MIRTAFSRASAARRCALHAFSTPAHANSLQRAHLDCWCASQASKLRLLQRIEELRLLSTVADAGLLSSAEEAGVFSKLEAAGAFSSAEKLLPLADDLKLLSTAETLLNVPSSTLFTLGLALLAGGAPLP